MCELILVNIHDHYKITYDYNYYKKVNFNCMKLNCFTVFE